MNTLRLRALGLGAAMAATTVLGAPSLAGASPATEERTRPETETTMPPERGDQTIRPATEIRPMPPERERPSDRAIRVCARIPRLIQRIENVIATIKGDVDTKGSLAWLDAAIARARAAERYELAEVLANRREVREASLAVFEARLRRLMLLAERCENAGISLDDLVVDDAARGSDR